MALQWRRRNDDDAARVWLGCDKRARRRTVTTRHREGCSGATSTRVPSPSFPKIPPGSKIRVLQMGKGEKHYAFLLLRRCGEDGGATMDGSLRSSRLKPMVRELQRRRSGFSYGGPVAERKGKSWVRILKLGFGAGDVEDIGAKSMTIDLGVVEGVLVYSKAIGGGGGGGRAATSSASLVIRTRNKKRNQMIGQKNPKSSGTYETLIAILEEEEDCAVNQNRQNKKSKSSTQNASPHYEKGGTLSGLGKKEKKDAFLSCIIASLSRVISSLQLLNRTSKKRGERRRTLNT
ncbi:hypothetical protein LR48_Vigan05g130600 [Vigna angularis]|uniref:Uncharacterized protein n=1 Tax=Phaseolus angularis TaxID=3914 RepID=A0A0L9ULX6_PHAAN|nr:hypothetical protein LR48_Vigan05g130600 [Vigna angularis]